MVRRDFRKCFSPERALAILALASLWAAGGPAFGATFVVDSTLDRVDSSLGDGDCLAAGRVCTLRAAIQQANALPGLDEIHLPAGTFPLTLAGAGEDAAATGDLDVTDDVTLIGAGEHLTILDAAGLDRLFDSHPPSGPGITLWLQDLTVRGGAPPVPNADGGCIRNPASSRLLLAATTLRGCRSARQGGAVFNAGSLEGVEVSFLDNGDPEKQLGIGGAIANIGPDAQVFLLIAELRGNFASNGGAIYTSAEFIQPNTSEVRLEQCSLIGNSVRQNGGAVLNNSRTRVFLEDSTVSGNDAGSGGGLFNDGGGIFLIRNSTITRNHASNIGGGISEVHFNPEFIKVRNSLLAGNTASNMGPDCNFRLDSEASTLVGNMANCEVATGPGDLLNVDPQLGPLTRFGPRTWGHLLGKDSPAIDAGSVPCTTTDQRGVARPIDGDDDSFAICDIGALEMGGEIFFSGFESGDTGEWTAAIGD